MRLRATRCRCRHHRAYVARVARRPAWHAWIADALAEQDFLDFEEPYRSTAMTARFYVVGGAVRDALLGRPASDRDWVVVGATPEALLAQGYRPVGKDFPVFIHPHTAKKWRWRAPNASRRPATTASPSTPRPR
jgi:hypothetical protein